MSERSPHIQTEDLSAYLDGFVEERHRSAIAGHLTTCVPCRDELSQLRTTVRLLNALPTLSPRKSFRLGPEHATARAPQSRLLTLLPAVRALSVAAAIALLVVSGAFLFDSSGADDRSSSIVFSEAGDPSGETDVPSDSSESAEDAENTSSAVDQAGDSTSEPDGLVDRGSSAAAGDAAMEAPLPDMSEAAQSPAEYPSARAGTTTAAAAADEQTIPWGSITLGLGAATIALAGIWFALSRLARSPTRKGT